MRIFFLLVILVGFQRANAVQCDDYLAHLKEHGLFIVDGKTKASPAFKYYKIPNNTKVLALAKNDESQVNVSSEGIVTVLLSGTPMVATIQLQNDQCENAGMYIVSSQAESANKERDFDWDWRTCNGFVQSSPRFFNSDGVLKTDAKGQILWSEKKLKPEEKKKYLIICNDLQKSGITNGPFHQRKVCPGAVLNCSDFQSNLKDLLPKPTLEKSGTRK